MDLKSEQLLWRDENGALYTYPTLKKNISCDVAIVGGGIVGSLISYFLSKETLSTVLIDKQTIACGSTSASTALLMYQLDEDLCDLIKKIGEKKAVRAYRLSFDSVKDIKTIIKRLGVDCKYKEKKVLYFASKKSDLRKLKKEYATLRKHDFPVNFVDQKDLKKQFSINKHAAITSLNAAEVDPYKLTHELVHFAHKKGLEVYTGTEIISHKYEKQKTTLFTVSGNRIAAKKVIFATGYESVNYLKENVVDLKSSYVIASKPVPGLDDHWLNDYLVWETSRPYLYMRSSGENRIIVGGEDVEYVNAKKRDALLPVKTRKLKNKFKGIVKDLKVNVDYSWTGTFGETKDGLGYIGIPKGFKETYFALGFGGNGITFGVIAAQMLTQMLLGKECKNKDLFAFER